MSVPQAPSAGSRTTRCKLRKSRSCVGQDSRHRAPVLRSEIKIVRAAAREIRRRPDFNDVRDVLISRPDFNDVVGPTTRG